MQEASGRATTDDKQAERKNRDIGGKIKDIAKSLLNTDHFFD